MGKPFLHAHHRFKNGKDHCYWSLVEKVRGPHGQWVQRPILYLCEINDSQKAAWIKTIEVFDADRQAFTRLALFPLQHAARPSPFGVRLRSARFAPPHPKGGRTEEGKTIYRNSFTPACLLWQQLHLDAFWSERLAASREVTGGTEA